MAKLRENGLAVTSINQQLEVLRRMLRLSVEWGKVERLLPRVEMLPGENHRETVLTQDEESRYLSGTATVGDDILTAHAHALDGIRARLRGEQPIEPADPYQMRDAATLLIDCGLRPEECFRLRWEHVRDRALHVPFGKTESARRTIPLTQRCRAFLEMRRGGTNTEWVFPAPTKTGHIEKSSLRKQHAKACKLAELEQFALYTLRHTCLTRWAPFMDPYTLAYLAGRSDFSTTRRYVHPQAHTVIAAIERAREAQGGPKIGHTGGNSETNAHP